MSTSGAFGRSVLPHSDYPQMCCGRHTNGLSEAFFMVNGFILIIENKRHSPQSMRPWLAMTHFDESFDGMLIPLDQGATRAPDAKRPRPSPVSAIAAAERRLADIGVGD